MSKVVDIARCWLGTPYVHQASTQAVGCDCLGLVRGVWRELHGDEPALVPAYTSDWDEVQGDEILWSAALNHLKPVDGAWRAGQILLFRMRSQAVAKHLGILSQAGETMSFIHAYSGHGVVESPLSRPWERRVVARFELEGS